MSISIFFRKSNREQYSIERVYSVLLEKIDRHIEVERKIMPYASKGVLRRILNVIYAYLKRDEVNHITGDINYAGLLIKRNVILTVHDVYPLYLYKGLKLLLIKYFWFHLPLKKASIVITVSNFSKNEILKHFKLNPSRIVVINNALAPYFKYSELKPSGRLPNILQIGTKVNKNLTNLILGLKGVKCKLQIIGKLNVMDKNLLKENSIAFETFESVSSSELIELYRGSSVVSFISTYEGFGLPIIEAQAIGRPVITSNCTSLPEIAGEGALLVNPESIEEINTGIKNILYDVVLREKLIEKGLENIKRYHVDDIAEKYMNVYNKLLGVKE